MGFATWKSVVAGLPIAVLLAGAVTIGSHPTGIAGRPDGKPPIEAFSEADSSRLLLQYYLLDLHTFEPNVLTSRLHGVSDHFAPTVTGADCGRPTIGAGSCFIPGLRPFEFQGDPFEVTRAAPAASERDPGDR